MLLLTGGKYVHRSELMQVPRRVFKGNPTVAHDWLTERQGLGLGLSDSRYTELLKILQSLLGSEPWELAVCINYSKIRVWQ